MRQKGGFTLIEVLIALAILGVGIVAIMQLFPASLRQTRLAAERTIVTNLATSQLSRLQSGDLRTNLSAWLQENTLHDLERIERIYALYEGWQTTVHRVPGGPDTYRVTFTVELANGRQETFVTYVTQR